MKTFGCGLVGHLKFARFVQLYIRPDLLANLELKLQGHMAGKRIELDELMSKVADSL